VTDDTFPDPARLFSLAGRVALVTGGSRGLGWAMAGALAAAGAHVVLAARDTTALEAAAAILSRQGLSASTVAFDVTDEAAATAAVARTVDAHGRLDVLVNNAGIVQRTALADTGTAEWRALMAVDLDVCFVLSREAAKPMVTQGWGRIVNVSSVLGVVTRPEAVTYTAAKHALHGLTKAIAVDLGGTGVTCNALPPGFFATEFNAEARNDPAFVEQIAGHTPAGRLGEVHELAGAIVFLASEASSYVTGHVLMVDGGMSVAIWA
jgi:gluconate 5-dehydrogenase